MNSHTIPSQLVIATRNPEKFNNIASAIKLTGLKLTLIKLDKSILEVVESASSSTENAILKAQYYFKHTRTNTLAEDDAVYFDGVPNDQQPRHLVKRLTGKQDKFTYWSKFIQEKNISAGKLIKSYCLITKNRREKSLNIIIPFQVNRNNARRENTNILNNFIVPEGFEHEIAIMSQEEKAEFRKNYIVSKLGNFLLDNT